LGPAATLIGVDRDEAAIQEASGRLAADTRFRAVRASFADLDRVLPAEGVRQIDGLLLDLGVSSRQIDEAGRGFAFSAEGPLDMRMDRETGQTAADLLNDLDPDDIADILFSYGEEPRARVVARKIAERRPIESTGVLASIVRSSVPTREEKKSLARVFQALRIAVNAELEALEAVLHAATHLVRPGGRLVAIAYHSLEDRRVKRYMRAGNFEGVVQRDVYGRTEVPWRLVTRHAVEASAAEVALNPRARSARLRIAERTDWMSSPDPRDGGERGGAGTGR
jgi:16S rRNA (cytosine1402-N4)-methyltransferase